MSNVRAGHQFERNIKRLLEADGFDVVRGAASKGRLANIDCDLVATKNTGRNKYEIGVALFQMKRSKVR